MKKTKTGRRSSEDEKARALEWVNLYRLAEDSPGGRYCVNPESEAELQTFIDANDPGPLLAALGSFARHGTFAPIDEFCIKEFILLNEFRALRASGLSYENTVHELAKRHHRSPRTIEREIASAK